MRSMRLPCAPSSSKIDRHPRTVDQTLATHQLDRSRALAEECRVVRQRVVERCELALVADLLQVALVGLPVARHDVVERAELPSAHARIAQEAVVAQVVVVVADEDVEQQPVE